MNFIEVIQTDAALQDKQCIEACTIATRRGLSILQIVRTEYGVVICCVETESSLLEAARLAITERMQVAPSRASIPHARREQTAP